MTPRESPQQAEAAMEGATLRGDAAPHSGREVAALVSLGMLVWFAIVVAIAELAALPALAAVLLWAVGAAMLVVIGLAWARRLRHR